MYLDMYVDLHGYVAFGDLQLRSKKGKLSNERNSLGVSAQQQDPLNQYFVNDSCN
jgi:hypothetical protein